jgi:Derlin-2/3
MTAVAPFVSVHFLGSSLTFMMVYVWGRRNEYVRMSFLGLFPFTAPYLPWVLLSFSVMLGNSATIDITGIVVGHCYFFLEDILPQIAEIRGWRTKEFMPTPRILHWMCGTQPRNTAAADELAPVEDLAPVEGVDGAADGEAAEAVPAAGEHAHQD